MKLINFAAFSMAITLLCALSACGDANSTTTTDNETKDTSTVVPEPKIDNTIDAKFSYAFGMLIGKNLMEGLGLTLNEMNLDELCVNFESSLNGGSDKKVILEAQKIVNTEAPKLAEIKKSGTGKKIVSPKLGPSFGFYYGDALKKQGLSPSDLKIEDFKKGVKAAMGEGTPEMDMPAAELVVNTSMQKVQMAMQAKMQAEMQAKAGPNLEAGKKFLAEIAKKPGIQSTPSGIYYEVMKKGTGAKPSPSSTVKTHYHGTLIDGTVFDSSVERGDPIEFGVNKVIQGWQEILPMMPTGSKWKVYIPSHLAYGEQGSPGGIGPNCALIFEIELFSFK